MLLNQKHHTNRWLFYILCSAKDEEATPSASGTGAVQKEQDSSKIQQQETTPTPPPSAEDGSSAVPKATESTSDNAAEPMEHWPLSLLLSNSTH